MSDITKTTFPATELSSLEISMPRLQAALESVAGGEGSVQIRYNKQGDPEFVEVFTPKGVDIDAAVEALVAVDTKPEESDKVLEQGERERLAQFSGPGLINKLTQLEDRVAKLEQQVKRG